MTLPAFTPTLCGLLGHKADPNVLGPAHLEVRKGVRVVILVETRCRRCGAKGWATATYAVAVPGKPIRYVMWDPLGGCILWEVKTPGSSEPPGAS